MRTKFIVRPLKGGPDAFAKLKPHAEHALGAKGTSPAIDVHDYRGAIVWLSGSVGEVIRLWHLPDGSQLSGEFLIKEVESDKRMVVVNCAGIDRIKATSPESVTIAMAPVIYQDHHHRAVFDQDISAQSNLEVDLARSATFSTTGSMYTVATVDESVVAYLEGEAEITAIGNQIPGDTFHGSTRLEGVGSIDAIGNKVAATTYHAVATVVGEGAIDAVGNKIAAQTLHAIGNVVGAGSITAVGNKTAPQDYHGVANLSGSGDVSGTGIVNGVPTADATGPSSATMGNYIELDAGNSSDPDGDSLSYNWSLISYPGSHSYTASDLDTVTPDVKIDTGSTEGDYTWEVTVSDGIDSDTDTHTVTWSSADTNDPPSADFHMEDSNGNTITSPTTETIYTMVSDSTDPDGDSLTEDWDVTTGTEYDWKTTDGSATRDIKFTDDGSFDIRLTVTDPDGASDDKTINYTVSNQAPTASVTGPDNAVDGETIKLDATGSSDVDGHIDTYSWSVVTEPTTNYTLTDNNDGTATVDFHEDSDSSTDYKFEVTVTDDDNATDTATHTVNVDVAPTASVTGPTSSTRSLTETYDGSGSDDVDTYSWSVINSPDGSSDDYTLHSTSGSTTDLTFDDYGSYTLELTVTSVDGHTDTDTIGISVDDVSTAHMQTTGEAGADEAGVYVQ